ncbi:hypothetical protein A2U01_0027676, partial [Trifolium medium]|nr:hypothetical protein [Trifolium medium]
IWNLHVAQGHVARCAGLSDSSGSLSASCAPRRVVWRIAPSSSGSNTVVLEVARCAVVTGALRRSVALRRVMWRVAPLEFKPAVS